MAAPTAPPAPPRVAKSLPRRGAPAAAGRPPRVPKRAAVTLTVAPGNKTSYADVMRQAMTEVRLAHVGITDRSPLPEGADRVLDSRGPWPRQRCQG